MIQGIGVDAVAIARFTKWHAYSDQKLSKIFSAGEIAYCRSSKLKSAERFAARFAAREGLYKALCQAYPETKWGFLQLCKATEIEKGPQGQPYFVIQWQQLPLPQDKPSPQALLTLTHTKELALAWVIIQG